MTAFSLVDQQPEERPKSLTQILAEPIDRSRLASTRFNNRLPAAVVQKNAESETSDVETKAQQKILIKMFCGEEKLKLNSKKQLMMLELSSCVELKDKHQLWVKNETNGFRAQIFKIDRLKFKTDFLQLNKGFNKVSLEGVLKDGQKIVQTLEVLSGS